MHTTMHGICALRKLRKTLQEDAGDDYPAALHTELLVLNDVCKSLDMNIGYRSDVLGRKGFEYVCAFMDTRISPHFPISDTQVIELSSEAVTHLE